MLVAHDITNNSESKVLYNSNQHIKAVKNIWNPERNLIHVVLCFDSGVQILEVGKDSSNSVCVKESNYVVSAQYQSGDIIAFKKITQN